MMRLRALKTEGGFIHGGARYLAGRKLGEIPQHPLDSMECDITLTARCITGLCPPRHVHTLNSRVARYVEGELVQEVWPELSTAQREAVIGWRTGSYLCDCLT
jgi:hypothetical protein